MAPLQESRLGFQLRSSSLRDLILIPKYYDPLLDADVDKLRASHDLLTLRDLLNADHIQLTTGHEVGKMAYGTGDIPFVRTSDITNWEIKASPKQSVSQAIYTKYAARQDVRPGDILLVRDGTYLIGTVAMVTEVDIPLLYQSHIVRIRIQDISPISGHLLLVALASELVMRQLQARRFTSDIIDTVGDRYMDVALPIPKETVIRSEIECRAKAIIDGRTKLRELIPQVVKAVER